jgi:hypothetical protein
MEVPINYWALLIGVVVNVILGSLWYGPLFRKPWMEMSGITMESINQNKKMSVGMSYGIMMLGSIIMAYVLWHALVFASYFTKTTGVPAGLMVGVWNWLGFIAPATLGIVLWEGKPWKLWMINAGYYLVALCLMGVIFAFMMPVL